MGLKEAEIEGCLKVGVVETNGQVGLLCLLGLQELLKDASGVIGSNHFHFIPGLVGELGQHFIGEGSNVVGQNSKGSIGIPARFKDQAAAGIVDLDRLNSFEASCLREPLASVGLQAALFSSSFSLRVHRIDDSVCSVNQIHRVRAEDVQRRLPTKGTLVQHNVQPPVMRLKDTLVGVIEPIVELV